MKRLGFLVMLLAAPFTDGATVDDKPIILGFNVVAPYKMKLPDGKVGGLVVTPVMAAFEKAGIPFTWEELPNPRQLALIKYNQTKICAVGIYNTPERAIFAKISKPISRDQPFSVVTGKQMTSAANKPTLSEIFSNKEMKIVLLLGRSYGSYLNALIKNSTADIHYVNSDLVILNMIENNHGQISLFETDKIDYFKKAGLWNSNTIFAYTPQDVPPAEYRYLICSKQVDDALIEKINKFLPTP